MDCFKLEGRTYGRTSEELILLVIHIKTVGTGFVRCFCGGRIYGREISRLWPMWQEGRGVSSTLENFFPNFAFAV